MQSMSESVTVPGGESDPACAGARLLNAPIQTIHNGERHRIGAALIRRRRITELELVLFHQGALPMSEILPLLREDLLASHSDESSDGGYGHPSRGDLPGARLLMRIRHKLHRIGQFGGRR
jgi:hypothetical protein